jgi:putative ABC transport system substrate-binding protein
VATIASPLVAHAQQADRIRRVDFLRASPPPARELDAFQRTLASNGYVQGRNLILIPAWGDGNANRFPELARALVSGGVDVILAEGNIAVRAAHEASTTIPIVLTRTADPFAGGLVSSLSRPGGHVTGFSTQAVDLTGKIIELLKELVPGFSRIAMIGPRVIWSMFGPAQDQAAKALGIESILVDLANPDLPGDAMQQAVSEKASGAVLRGTPFFSSVQRKGIVDAAAGHRLPVIYESREYVEQGGLASYGTDGVELYRRAADYVVRILGGANPSELPIQQPTKFELAINVKTAKALGLTVPSKLLFTADEVIE